MMQGCWLHDSSLLNLLEQCMCLYSDLTCPMSLRDHLRAPFRHAMLTTPMDLYNKSMSHVWVSVEWTFGEIVRSFKFLDFKSNLKLGLSSVGKIYIVYSLYIYYAKCFKLYVWKSDLRIFWLGSPFDPRILFLFVIVNFVVQTLIINSTLKLIYSHDNVNINPFLVGWSTLENKVQCKVEIVVCLVARRKYV